MNIDKKEIPSGVIEKAIYASAFGAKYAEYTSTKGPRGPRMPRSEDYRQNQLLRSCHKCGVRAVLLFEKIQYDR